MAPILYVVARQFNNSLATASAVSAISKRSSPSVWNDTITNVIFGVIATVSACISIWQAHRYFHGLVESERK